MTTNDSDHKEIAVTRCTGERIPIRPVLKRHLGLISILSLTVTLSSAVTYAEAGETPQCGNYNAEKNVYFGDLHTHTSLSFDAIAQGTRTTPPEAYNFAKGYEIDLPPYNSDGTATRTAQLERPLDFLAVTDHSEYFGEVAICMTCGDSEGSPFNCSSYANSSDACKVLQDSAADPEGGSDWFGQWAMELALTDPAHQDFCVPTTMNCSAMTASIWAEVQNAANTANDPCDFTAFIGYEWSGTPDGNNWHRNVIFENESVPGLPFSAMATGPYGDPANSSATVLWEALNICKNHIDECDVLAIPHNSNLSAGSILPVPSSADDAETQAMYEPLAEIHQTKGNSECRLGVGTTDEECGFELMSKLQLFGDVAVKGPIDPDDSDALSATEQGYPAANPSTGNTHNEFLREILKGGLYLGDEVGVNPYKLGFVGGTDSHVSTPGAVGEDDYQGQHGATDDTIRERLSADDPAHDGLETNPGGLTAVWAEENTRESIFDALRNRETYATSGIRPTVRFFGGWEYPEDLCESSEFVEIGYRDGVPMGSDLLQGAPENGAPKFAVMAMKDTSGTQLQRIQIIKGWLDAGGTLYEEVYDVVGDPGDASEDTYVDLSTCEEKTDAPGDDTLCAVWQDPDFDPTESAFYYARVLENPTCRWSTRQCLEAGDEDADCWERLATPANADTDNPGVVVGYTLQERAWTSSIWYEPAGD